jgi:AraC-like DNA-binding protein
MSFSDFHTFGIQMNPIAVNAIFGLPLCEIKDYFVEGAAVIDDIGLLEDVLYSGRTFIEKAQWFECFLLKKIKDTPELHLAMQLDNAIVKFIDIKDQAPQCTLEELLGYSRTHTFRLFKTWFGTSSHSFIQLRQFIKAVESLHGPFNKLIDVGLDNRYYDQSHFIRNFHDFAGMTPGDYVKLKSSVPGQLYG